MWATDLAAAGCDVSRLPVHVVDVVTALLRIANAQQPATRQDRRNPIYGNQASALQKAVDDIAHNVCKSGRTEFLSRGPIEAVLRVLDDSALPHGLAALSAADALDAHFGSAFIDYFRGERRLAPGDPVPILPFSRAELVELVGRPTGNPGFRTELDDRVSHLRLAPETVTGFPVTMVWAEPELPAVSAAARYAAAVTNVHPFDELEWDRYEVGGRALFYRVRPRSVATQADIVTSAIDRAVEASATFLVLPELSLTKDLAGRLGEQVSLRELPVVAAGSFHTDEPDGRNNVCTVYAYGEEIAIHRKFTDFHFDDGGERRHEHLDPSAGFPLIVGPRCTLAIMICKDAIDARVGRLVQELAPRITLIPALSPDVDAFVQLAGSLARDPQAMTLIACSGGTSGAILGTPRKAEPVILHAAGEPQLVVFSSVSVEQTTGLP